MTLYWKNNWVRTMSIEGISSLGGLSQAQDRKIENDAKAKNQPKTEDVKKDDSVEVRGDVAKLKTALEDTPDVRSDKIEALQEQIKDGSYKVPSERIADIILDELI